MITGPQQPNSDILLAPAVPQYLFMKITIFTQYELIEMVGDWAMLRQLNFISIFKWRGNNFQAVYCLLLWIWESSFSFQCSPVFWHFGGKPLERLCRRALQWRLTQGKLKAAQMQGMTQQRNQAAGFQGFIPLSPGLWLNNLDICSKIPLHLNYDIFSFALLQGFVNMVVSNMYCDFICWLSRCVKPWLRVFGVDK